MKKYPSINQFRSAIREVRSRHDYKGKDSEGNAIYQHTENYPVLEFRGTVKLHGTNAAIVKYKDGSVRYQSRERILTLESDNSNFMECLSKIDTSILFDRFNFDEYVAIYGEWCGGNIQKGVAINGLPKMFVIFGVKIDGEWIDLPSNLHLIGGNIYNILQFPTYNVIIDFNNPEVSQNYIVDNTIEVENMCPVGAYFGKKGIGEGIVFNCISDYSLTFKSKGEKHSVTKVKTLSPIDVDVMSSINEFVDITVTENRLQQGLSFFRENNIENDPKNTGQFLSWIVKDVLKEESDRIGSLDEKKIKNGIVVKARTWFLNNI